MLTHCRNKAIQDFRDSRACVDHVGQVEKNTSWYRESYTQNLDSYAEKKTQRSKHMSWKIRVTDNTTSGLYVRYPTRLLSWLLCLHVPSMPVLLLRKSCLLVEQFLDKLAMVSHSTSVEVLMWQYSVQQDKELQHYYLLYVSDLGLHKSQFLLMLFCSHASFRWHMQLGAWLVRYGCLVTY